MDFLDEKKRRAHTIKLFIGYGLMSILIAIITVSLVYFSYGYNVTREGEVVQRGLVFVSSQPSNSDLFVDDKKLSQGTNAKLSLVAGKHTIRIQREGYVDWNRTITVDGGTVTHYTYPVLMPKTLATNNLKVYDTNLGLSTQSPDNRWLLLAPAASNTFEQYDLRASQQDLTTTTLLNFPAGLLGTQPTTRWELAEWSTNNRHVLLKRYFAAETSESFEYILLNRDKPEASRNIGFDLTLAAGETVTMRDKNPEDYYIYNAAQQQLDSSSLDKNNRTKVLDGVLAYKSHGEERVLYVSANANDSTRVDVSLRENATQTYKLRTILSNSSGYLLDIAEYKNDWFISLGQLAGGRVYVYKNPVEVIKESAYKRAGALFATTIDKPTHISFSNNARFILLQNAVQAQVYDVEKNEDFRYNLVGARDGTQPPARWVDGYRITYVSDGKQLIADYDNLNRHSITDVSGGNTAVFDQDSRYMYSVLGRTDAQTGFVLRTTALRTEADL